MCCRFPAITWRVWVTSLPGAVGHIQAFGTGPLLLGTAGLLLLCLLRSPLRWSGVVLAVAASLWAVLTPRPDVLISGEGQAAAIRGADGRLALLHSGRDTFATREWLAADGDDRTVKDASLNAGVRCDDVGCIGRLKDGRLVSMALAPEAFLEDCARAAVVVSAREAPGDCSALLIDRNVWRSQGAVALRWVGDRFEQTVARPPGIDRPWARAPAVTGSTTSPARPASPDATPSTNDLEAGDQ
jgi:competence protein ComEC